MFGKGRNKRNIFKQKNNGTSQLGVCICPQCNYSKTHERGIPCVSLLCPKCDIPLVKQNLSENKKLQTNINIKQTNLNLPKIATDLCIGCGACIKTCPANAIFIKNKKATIITEKCKNCRLCVNTCPVHAIT